MRRYRIERHPLVESDFDAIQDYIAPFAGLEATVRIMRTVRQRVEELAGFPHIGTVRTDISAGLRALPAAEKAVVCFTVNDKTRTVKIVCVAYAGQDWQTIVKSRGPE